MHRKYGAVDEDLREIRDISQGIPIDGRAATDSKDVHARPNCREQSEVGREWRIERGRRREKSFPFFRGLLTVEEVLGEGVIGHEFGHEEPLVAVAAVADQVGQPLVPQLPDAPGLLLNKSDEEIVSQRLQNPSGRGELRGIETGREVEEGQIEVGEDGELTANCLGSGQAILPNFFTAIHRRFWRRPL